MRCWAFGLMGDYSPGSHLGSVAVGRTGGEPPRAVMERQGLKQISDTAALEAIVAAVLAANPKQVEQYKSGKGAVLGFFVGQVMKVTRGQANPAIVNQILQRSLS
jgi:aspartyl-tRNA(Asn)/glutamyl-tRNA(Gln) amidotransferase subunit B